MNTETYTCAKCALQFALKEEGIRNTCFECDMPYCNDCMCEKNGKCYDCLDDEDADDGEWCNEDCEKNEGCIKCNPFAYCSPATLEEWLAREKEVKGVCCDCGKEGKYLRSVDAEGNFDEDDEDWLCVECSS